jgi:multidrug resistance efflux pump
VRRLAYEQQFPDVQDKDPVLRPLQDAVRAQEGRIREIEIQRRGLALRSPVAGRVTQVLARHGQAVLPGEPLAFVMEHVASEIVAYAPEDLGGRVAERARVAAIRRQPRPASAESIVARVGPAIEVMPQRLWRDPAIPEYGRPFLVSAVPALGLTAGEIVTVRLIDR